MVRKDRPAGIRLCGMCGEMADHGAGQGRCKECRAAVARARRAEFNHGVEVLWKVLGG